MFHGSVIRYLPKYGFTLTLTLFQGPSDSHRNKEDVAAVTFGLDAQVFPSHIPESGPGGEDVAGSGHKGPADAPLILVFSTAVQPWISTTQSRRPFEEAMSLSLVRSEKRVGLFDVVGDLNRDWSLGPKFFPSDS